MKNKKSCQIILELQIREDLGEDRVVPRRPLFDDEEVVDVVGVGVEDDRLVPDVGVRTGAGRTVRVERHALSVQAGLQQCK